MLLRKEFIKGAELTTAKANGELPKNHVGRKSHSEGKRIIVEGSTSTKEVSLQKSSEFYKTCKKCRRKEADSMELRVKILVVTILFFIISNILSYSKVIKIKFIFTKEGVTVPVAVSCNQESFNWFNILDYKIVKDSTYISKFDELLMTLKPDTINQYVDARIMAIISHDDTIQRDTLCFGEFGGIDFNGVLMQNNQELLKLVKQEVWPKESFDSVNEEDSIKVINIQN